MPVHHPSLDLLCAVAAGEQSPGVHKIVLAHAALCLSCRATLDRFEVIGGAQLEDEAGEALSSGALERALTAIAEQNQATSVATTPDWLQAVPAAVRDLAADILTGTVSKGVVSLNLMQSVGSNRETMEIVRVEPGKGIPAHVHEGTE